MDYLLKNIYLIPISETLESIFSYINLSKPLNKMRALEIGIGNGNCSIPMSKKFRSYYGIEPLSNIYDVFIKTCSANDCRIKSYNMNLDNFAKTTDKKFDIIILKNVIHFIGYDELIKQCRKIVKKNAFIIIQNPQPKSSNWGNNELNADSAEYNEIKWLKLKKNLETHYEILSNSEYLDKFVEDNKYIFFVLKTDNKFT